MKYLYYTMYRLFSKIRTNDTPATNAMIFISVCEFANGITILNLAKIPLKGDTQNEVISIAIIISLTVMLINYFIILNLGKNPRLQAKTLVSLLDANV